MIARTWRGATKVDDAQAYVDYLRETGLKDYEETPGNRGAWVLWRETEGRAEFLTLSLWDSMESVVAFAGEEPERAVFYPEDDRFLTERDVTAVHYHVETTGRVRPA